MRDVVLPPISAAPDEVARRLFKQGDLFAERSTASPQAVRAIEDDGFPFEVISEIAQAESWRKEINRPLSHVHKWWAQRLGSVFRAIVIGVFSPSGTPVMDRFYKPTRIDGKIVLDPFMGSGTTLTETVKLGGRAVGRDINPVAAFLVRTALSQHNRKAIEEEYRKIERNVADEIGQYYRCMDGDGSTATVLYYFWVKVVECPKCLSDVDLFGNYVFARHAYASRHPKAQVICPTCGEINEARYDAMEVTCRDCGSTFDPQVGAARGQKATCPCCSEVFSISREVKKSSEPPRHRLYAKLVLTDGGEKQYRRIKPDDLALYDRASEELLKRKNLIPSVQIDPGYNTNQAIGYNYDRWDKMFNERQLLCLSILSERIAFIEEEEVRDLFACLFSGTLEFNNQFTSFKGEGTGAVRHMFAHHVLKPERVPLEANPWGTPKSSGAFSTLYRSRITRALDYAADPFELAVVEGKSKKVYGLSDPMGFRVATNSDEFVNGATVYVGCGDSGSTDLPDGSVDAVVTDPPFFDNVHYSELADFFQVWLREITAETAETTRHPNEVQHGDPVEFATRLRRIWKECHRVLKDEGLLVFTYHHSRPDGWSAVLESLVEADFVITATQPIKAEMSVAMPKNQAKEPIDLDIIIVCRKGMAARDLPRLDWREAATKQVERFQAASRRLSRNDVLVIVMSQLIRWASRNTSSVISTYEQMSSEADLLIAHLHAKQKD